MSFQLNSVVVASFQLNGVVVSDISRLAAAHGALDPQAPRNDVRQVVTFLRVEGVTFQLPVERAPQKRHQGVLSGEQRRFDEVGKYLLEARGSGACVYKLIKFI